MENIEVYQTEKRIKIKPKMGSAILLRRLICLHLLVLLSAGQLAAQTEEKLLDDINQLPEVERQARLVNGAKKEGTVTWYVAMNRTYAQDLINAFEAQYPFLKVNALTGGGGALLNRVLAEHRAKSFQYDVFNTRSMTVNTLKKAGAIMRYRSPYRNSLREGFYDREGYLNGIFATPLVFIFNTKLVSRKEAPTTIEELLNPNWSGKMAVDDESFDWLAALLDYYGEAKGLELATKLGRQKLNVRRGPTRLPNWLPPASSFWRLTAITRKPSPEKGRERRLTITFLNPSCRRSR